MQGTQPVFVGIDGGATYSFGVAVDARGRTLATEKSGSLNFFGTTLQEARRSLTQLVRSLETGLPLGARFAQVVIGSAALFAESTAREKDLLCRGVLPLEHVRLVSDVMTAYHGAGLGRSGVLIVGGTGSSFLAKNEDGEFAQVGAWGHLLGDEGSAYWIARECVRAAIAASEGTGPATSLLGVTLRWFDVKELTEIVPLIYTPKFSKDRFGALAGFASREADPADPVWQGICDRAGRELAAQALAAIRLVQIRQRPIPVWLNGSVAKLNLRVRDSLFAALAAAVPVELEPPRLAPLLGAAALALNAQGILVTPEIVDNLARTYEEALARKAPPPAEPAEPPPAPAAP
jgi:N-acetylglucosamine kinase-like BadF-type ATPase